jgi:tetratricopeptide (TPR) repeat protein
MNKVATAMSTSHFVLRLSLSRIAPEDAGNETGYYFLMDKQYEKALSFFQLNIKNYPGSQNAHDSMGDYYVTVDDKAKAIEFFKKALEIGERPETRKKLEDLQKENKSEKPKS